MTTANAISTEPVSTIQRSPAWLVIWAFAGAVGISFIALFDAATHGITGAYSVFAADSPGWQPVVGDLVHGLGYAAFTTVLLLRATDIDRGRRVVRWLRLLTAASAGVLALGFLVVLFQPAWAGVGSVGTIAFLTVHLFAASLGVALLATGRRTAAAWSLTGILAAIALIVVLAFTASDWAHPGYAETALHFGLALLALSQAPRRS